MIFAIGLLLFAALATSIELQFANTSSPDADPRVSYLEKVSDAARRHLIRRGIIESAYAPTTSSILRNAHQIAGLDANYEAIESPPRDQRLGATILGFAPTAQGSLCRALTVILWMKADPAQDDPTFRYASSLIPVAENVVVTTSSSGDFVWKVVPLKSAYEDVCTRMQSYLKDLARAFERRARAKIDNDPLRDASVNYLYGEPNSAESISTLLGPYQRRFATVFVSFADVNAATGYKLADMLGVPRTTGYLNTMNSDGENPLSAGATGVRTFSICIAVPSGVATSSATPPYRLDIYWTPPWISETCAGPTNGAFVVAAIQSIQ